MKRIGLFGGTFDPIHRGHLQVARDVAAGFGMETIVFVPAAVPPHKPRTGIAAAGDRIAMIRLAVSETAGLAVSDVELKRPGPSYTIDTVTYFRHRHSRETGLFFILGLDAFFEIDTWKSYKSLFRQIPFIVTSRPGTGQCTDAADLDRIAAYIRDRISGGYRAAAHRRCFVHDHQQPVHVAAVQPVDISSTRIRQRIRSGRSIRELVPPSVENYINRKGLYR